ncbi:MAG TPA: lipoyl(octanoyl) transferase LipB [Thermoanaerobaculia bacterium]|nr:lipoyl(octanoyl) transferase LipB [Thermoanaerobaculia bacterium]
MVPEAEGPRSLCWSYLGRVPYGEALGLQLDLREALRRGEGDEQLLLLEHPHVYTLGRNAAAADVLATPEWLAARGVEVVETDRGGQVTYHGPGQLVGYPILNLSPDRRDIRRYVRDLEEVLLRTLADYGVRGELRPGQDRIGVWFGERKIAAIGVHLSRWLTTHGFALNVATDLSFFSAIVPCGLRGSGVVSLRELLDNGRSGPVPGLADVAATLAHHFAQVFERRLVAAGAVEAPPAAPPVHAGAAHG